MTRLAEWMRDNGFPHDRKDMTPFAMGGLTSLAEITAADDAAFARATKTFAVEQRALCRQLVAEAAAAQAAAAAAAAAAEEEAAKNKNAATSAGATAAPGKGKTAMARQSSWFVRNTK
jgi:hypothetical protein